MMRPYAEVDVVVDEGNAFVMKLVGRTSGEREEFTPLFV